MTLLMLGVNKAVKWAKCDGTIANMTLLMPEANMAVKMAKFDNIIG